MNSLQAQQELCQFIRERNFDAPYGVLESEGRSQRGRRYLSITFGRCRTLDAEIQIYGPSFITLRHSRDRHHLQVLRSLQEVKDVLTSL